MARDIPALAASLVVHVVLLLWLALVGVARPEPARVPVTVMVVGVPLFTVMRRVAPASAVPMKVGVVSLVKPPEVIEPVTGDTLSVTLVITG